MKKILKIALAVGFAGIWLTGAHADYSPMPVANLTEKWAADSGWLLIGGGVRVYNGDSLSIKFPASNADYPPSTADQISELAAAPSSSGGRFSGDFNAAGVVEVAFDVKRDGVAQQLTVWFMASSGARFWRYNVSLPDGASEWVHVTVPFEYSDQWGAAEGGAAAEFAADRADVVRLGVMTMRGDQMLVQQQLALDNFKVVGPWGGDLTQDGLPFFWLQEYGIAAGDGHAVEDPDHDGFNNYGEFLAGTDPNDASSLFKVEIDKREDGQAVLRWKHELGRQFTVLRSRDLTGGFTACQAGILSGQPANEFVLDEQDGGPYFYRVRIDQ